MRRHFPFQLQHFVGLLRQWRFITFSQFFHTLGERLANAIHFAVDGEADGASHLSSTTSVLISASVSVGIWHRPGCRVWPRHLLLLLEVCFLAVKFQPGVEGIGFFLGFFVTFHLFQPGGDVGFVDFIQLRVGTVFAAVFFFQFR